MPTWVLSNPLRQRSAGPRRRPSGWACRIAVPLLVLAPLLTPLGLRADTVARLNISALRTLVEQPRPLERLAPVDGGGSFNAYLVACRHAGLRLQAWVAVTKTPPPPQHYPVLVANRGFHPDPPRYGITPEGAIGGMATTAAAEPTKHAESSRAWSMA